MSRPLRLWRRPAVYRSAIGLYIFVVLAVAGVTFAVNSIDVQGALYVRGEPDLERDRTHGMRGVFHYAPTGEMLVPEQMDWFLDPVDGDDAAVYPLRFVDGPAHQSWPDPSFRLADDIPDGDYHLRVDASHRQVAQMEAGYPVTVSQRPPPASIDELRWPRQTAREDDAQNRDPAVEIADEDRQPEVMVSLAPADGELVRGMPQSLYLRTWETETGRPVPATLEFDLANGLLDNDLPESVRTNRLGFADIELQPATTLAVDVIVEPAPPQIIDPDADADAEPLPTERFELNLPAVATQYSLQPTSPVVTPGDTIDAVAHSVLSDGHFMVDLHDHQGDRLLDTASLLMTDGKSGVQFDAPDPGQSSPLVRLQSYQSIYGTTHGWDGAYVLVVEDDSEQVLRDATADLFAWIGESSSSPHHRALADGDYLDDLSRAQLLQLLRAGVREIPRTFEMPPVVLNTREDDRRELDVWRAEVQKDLRWMMGLTLFVGLIVVLYFIVAGIRRNQRETAALREFELETSDPLPQQQRRAERIERLTVALQGIIVFFTLLVFALGILIMVSYL